MVRLPPPLPLTLPLTDLLAGVAMGMAVMVSPCAVLAGDVSQPEHKPAGFELRAGLFAHDPTSPEPRGVDISAEILLPRLPGPAGFETWMPRLHAGGMAATAGGTSYGYAGLTWSVDLTRTLFVEAALGGAVSNAPTGPYGPPDRSALGCRGAFREAASVGVRITPQLSMLGTLEHLSNAGLCSSNRGLSTVGVRVGYSF
ncbi:MAG: acyloxyacyl hydrolase [Alsobacter sp.]